MEKSEIPASGEGPKTLQEFVRPPLSLEMDDVRDLQTVLRGYYLRQIKGLKKRKDRRLARQLLENHLLLPKSRQRTSKDGAYIKEVLGIEPDLLAKLEDSRLIRRIHKTGNNPIYEISHDTLVEPILAEKRNREAVMRFLKKSWKYAAVFLLLWFYFGMWFQNAVEVLPNPPHQSIAADTILTPKTVNYDKGISLLKLPPLLIPPGLEATDTLNVEVPIQFSRLRIGSTTAGSSPFDTLAINLASPIEVAMNALNRPVTYRSFSNVVVPLAYANGDLSDPDANRIYANLSGNLRIIKTSPGEDDEAADNASMESPTSYQVLSLGPPLEVDLGDTLVRARSSTRSIPVSHTLRLVDLFADEADKNTILSSVGDRPIRLNYTVKVSPAPVAPPPPKTVVPEVQGIEVQYSDGTRKFIPGGEPAGTEVLHTVVKGETLYSIARDYNITDSNGKISAEPIKRLNGLSGNSISVGQQLRIPPR